LGWRRGIKEWQDYKVGVSPAETIAMATASVTTIIIMMVAVVMMMIGVR
jgi:hypothetical protein